MMRIAVIGAGAVGGVLAALADRGGHEVTVTARGEHLERIRSAGLRLEGRWGSHTAHPTARTALTQTPDLALLCVKTPQTRQALAANREALTATTLVSVQNGLTALETAAELLPETGCLGGLALFAANLDGPGLVRVTGTGGLYVGAGAGPPSPAARHVAEVFAPLLPTRASANFVGCQWTKLIVNQVNALPAITGLSVQETIADADTRAVLTTSMREAIRVGTADGIRYGRLQGLGPALLRLVAAAPTPLAALLPRAIARRMGPVANYGSTLQSVRRGRRTEIDDLHGAIVDAATRIGVDAPVNRRLVELVHAVEDGAGLLGPRQVRTRVLGETRRRRR